MGGRGHRGGQGGSVFLSIKRNEMKMPILVHGGPGGRGGPGGLGGEGDGGRGATGARGPKGLDGDMGILRVSTD